MSVTMPKQSNDPSKDRPPAPSGGGGDSPLKNVLLGVFLIGIGAFLLSVSRRPKGLAVGVIAIIAGPIALIMGIVGFAKKK